MTDSFHFDAQEPTRGHSGRGRGRPRHVGGGRRRARVPRLQRGRVASRVGAAATADAAVAAVGRVELGPRVLGHERPVDGEHGELLEPLRETFDWFVACQIIE